MADELPDTEIEDKDTAGEDLASALKDISTDLFGQDSGEDADKDKSEVGEGSRQTPTDAEAPPQAKTNPDKSENSEAVQATGAPSTWSKEEIADWATVPESAKKAIQRREADIMNGFKEIQSVKDQAELGGRYDKVVEPFREILAHQQVDPVQLFQSFASNHYLLTNGTPEQKLDLATMLMTSYGIPIDKLQEKMANLPPAETPREKELRERLERVEGGQKSRDEQDLAARRADFGRQVEAFASDPKNVYFADVSADMAQLLSNRVVNTLQEAYDMAVSRNPQTRQKEATRLADEIAASRAKEAEERKAKVARAKGANLTTTTKPRDGTVPAGSMDETLEETLASIKARG